MQPESSLFSPALENVLGRIKEAGKADYFFEAGVNSLKYLRGEITSIANEKDWQDVRFGSMEKKAIPALKQAREAVDWKRLAVACGPGEDGAANLAQLFREMEQLGLITGKEPIEDIAVKAVGLLAFPMDHLGHKRLRKWFGEIVKDELVKFPAAGLQASAERAVDILAWEKARYGFAADLGEKYEEDVDSGRIESGQEIGLQPDKRENEVSRELTVKPIPDRVMPAALIDVRRTGKSLEILPNLGQNSKNNQEAIAANLTFGEHNLTLSVIDDNDSTSLKLQAEVGTEYLHTDILNRLKAVKGFEGASKSSGVIEINIDGQEFWISKIGVGNGDGINIRWRQKDKLFINESFADLCRLATAAFNLALGLPVPEAEEKVDLPEFVVKSKFFRDMPDEELSQKFLAARRENQQKVVELKEEKPITPKRPPMRTIDD